MNTRRSGFALPMTIIAVAGLTLLLVGLMTVLTLERKTARSYSDAARADLAVESGLATALATITEIAKSDDSVVFRIEDPVEPQVSESERPLGYREQFFTYGAVHENGNWRGLPLFSGSQEVALGTREIEADLLQTDLNNYIADAIQIGRLTEHDQTIPRAKWVDVPATDPKGYDLRYAFWVEDLSGRINGTTAGLEPRDLGLNSAELDFGTVFEPDSTTGQVPVSIETKRDSLRTSASVRPILSEDEAKRIEPYIYYYPSTATVLPATVIPKGFGYADEGLPAPDLNELVASADVQGIYDKIEKNLPDFKNRRGGFPDAESYLKTIAASIIDYADEDSDSTFGANYRGVDSFPFVNELFDRYEWVAGGANEVKISVETYVELWNLSQQTVTGVVQFRNENRHEISIPPGGTQNFSPVTFSPVQVTIPPNGFIVQNVGSRTYSFPTGAFPPSSLNFNTTTNNNFVLRWNGRSVDTAQGGIQRTSGTLRAGSSNRKWKGNSSPALDYSIGQSGDPRSSYYIATWVFANNYDANSNWGGRCLKRDIGNSNYNEVRLEKWADSGSNSTEGKDAGSDARRPTEVVPPVNQPTMAPAFISNAGRYISLGEMGNVFDPAQLEDVNSTTPRANQNSGGGFTLAIGRPEFRAFDQEGRRSAQLMDLFSIDDKSYVPRPGARPVNINTAPYEVLRSLVSGVVLDADPATPGAKVPKDKQIGDIFAQYVMAHRKQRPLRGFSDLNLIRKNPAAPSGEPFFGSLNAFTAAPAQSWDDAGREELLRKTMNLTTFRSKVFRVVVAGEARTPSGELIGRATREYHYSIEPERDTAGIIIPGGKLRITKHYEKSL